MTRTYFFYLHTNKNRRNKSMDINVFYGILIPFLGTSAGAACVFFMKKNLNEQIQRALTGFAAGVMVAASIWSLLIPAIEQSSGLGKFSFVPAAVGFWIGVLFLLLLDHMIPHLHQNSNKAEGPKSKLQRTTMLVLAVTLHNIPEHRSLPPVHWLSPWASPSRTSRKEPLSPCPCVLREWEKPKPLQVESCPGL